MDIPRKEHKTVEQMTEELLHEIEEEDIGISLFSTFYQDRKELCFFKLEDQEKILKILRKLSEDSTHHKKILERILEIFGERRHEK